MNKGTYFSLLYLPATGREPAAERSEIFAVVINAIYGIFVVAAVSPQLLSMFTVGFVVTVALVFGPLIGFIFSSLYTRVVMTVSRRLGGKATLDELYRLFAWSFIPTGMSMLLYTLLVSMPNRNSTALDMILSIPVFVLFCCGIRNYCSNTIAAQRFTRIRGFVSISLSFILFLVLLAGGIGFITIIFKLSGGETLLSLVNLL